MTGQLLVGDRQRPRTEGDCQVGSAADTELV